jgi:hypothetical protein
VSAVGFNPAPVNELEELRKAYGSLNDVTRNLADAVKCINRQDLKLAEARLSAANWHLEQAKRKLVAVAEVKTKSSQR